MGLHSVQRTLTGSCDAQYTLSSAYLVSFNGSCVIAACYEFIIFCIDKWLYIDLLITRETNCRNRHNFQEPCDYSFRKLNLTKIRARGFVGKIELQNTHQSLDI